MSLLNQVLLDLDQRHAAAGQLPAQTRSVLKLPAPRFTLRRIGTMVTAATGIALAAAVTLAWPLRPGADDTTGAGRAVADAARAPLFGRDGARPIGFGLDPVNPAGEASNLPLVPLPALSLQDAGAAAPASEVAAAPADAASAAGASLAVSADATANAAVPAAAASAADDSVIASLAPPAPATVPGLPLPEARLEKRSQPFSPRQRAETEYQRALGLHQQGQGKDAQAGFAGALKEDPGHVAARQALAVAMIGEGRLDEAQTLLVEGLQIGPQETALATVLARIKVEQRDIPGAIAVLKAALPSNAAMAGRDTPEARALLATLQQRSGNDAEAIENYNRALRQAPTNGAWWVGLALSLTAQGRLDNARDAFEHARATQNLGPELDLYVDQRLRALPR